MDEESSVAAADDHDSYGVTRILALSDGIFAIAMTLLVLDIPVPQLAHPTNADLLRALADLRPNFASFVLSFVLVGLNWTNHHRMLRNVVRSDQRLLMLNLLLLLLVCLVPFASALLSRDGDLATAVIFYASNVCLLNLVSAIVRLHLWRSALLDPNPGRVQVIRSLANTVGTTGIFAISIPLSLWNPSAAEFFWILLIPLRAVSLRLHWQ